MKTLKFALLGSVAAATFLLPATRGFAQTGHYGNIQAHVGASPVQPVDGMPLGVGDGQSGGLEPARGAIDAFGVTGQVEAVVSTGDGRIGVTSTGNLVTSADADPVHARATSAIDVTLMDSLYFYSRSILYGQPIDLHLQAQVSGLADFLPADLNDAGYGTGSAHAAFTFSLGDYDNPESVSYSVAWLKTGPATVTKTETGDPVLDLYIRVRNTPNWFETLRLNVQLDTELVQEKTDAVGEELHSSYALLYGSTFAWRGIVSATSNGVPVTDVYIGSQSLADYNRSYVDQPPLSSVPEPSAYAAVAGLLLAGLVIRRHRRRRGDS